MRCLFLLILLISQNAWTSPAEEPPDHTIPILETAQGLLNFNVNYAANQLDSFFATERADDELGRSRIRIRSQFTMRERAISDQSNQYRINLRLPHLEERFKLSYYEDKKDEKSAEGKTKTEIKKEIDANKLHTGWIFNADMGVSVAIPPKLITRARVRKNYATGTLIHRFVEQLTYITDESGLVEETSLNTDHSYNENLLFRFVNTKRWQVLKKNFSTAHGPTLLHRVTDNDAFAYGAIMSSVITKSVWFVSSYTLSVDYRRNLYKQWMYLDIIPGLDFPKQWSFRRTPFIIFQLEILFGS